MSIHRDCGEPIRWAEMDIDPGLTPRYLPPLEEAGTAFILDGNVAKEVHTYRLHRCDPEKVAAWQEYCRKMEELKNEAPVVGQTVGQIARNREREEVYQSAMRVECPNCGAARNQPCRDMRKGNKNYGNATRWPHTGRESLAMERVQG